MNYNFSNSNQMNMPNYKEKTSMQESMNYNDKNCKSQNLSNSMPNC